MPPPKLSVGNLVLAAPGPTDMLSADDFEALPQDDFEPVKDDFEPMDPEFEVDRGGASMLNSGPPTGMPELLKRPAEPEFGGQTEGDVTYTPGPLGGVLKSAVDAIDRFEKKHIDPIIKSAQESMQRQYMYGIAGKPTGSAPGLGRLLRNYAPEAAYAAENVGKLALGETEVNKPGSEHPVAVQAQNAMEQRVGVTGAAAYQSGLQGFSNLPLYLIPGVGENAILQGATGGALSAAADPEQTIVEGAVGGAGAGAVLGGVIKGASALYGKIKGAKAPKLEPIALLPGDEESAFADTVIRMVDEAPAPAEVTKAATPRAKATPAKDVTAVVTALDDAGKPVTKAVTIQGSSVKTQIMKAKDAPKTAKRIISDEARQFAIDNPNSPQAYEIFPPPEGTFDLQRNLDLMDWDASRSIETREGSVLVNDGQGGAARLYDISNPKLQMETLRDRGLAEVRLPDGRKVRGFLRDDVLVPPDVDEAIPFATKEVVPAPDARLIESDSELKNILADREAQLEAQAADAARFEADLKASEMDRALGGDGSGGKLPPPPPMQPPPPPPPKPHNVSALDELKLKWADAHKWTSRKLLNPTVRGWQDAADLAFSTHSVDTLQRLAPDTMKQLEGLAPQLQKMQPWQLRQAHADISDFAEGVLSRAELEAKQPLLAKTLHDAVQAHKLRIAEGQQRLKDLGMLSDDVRANEWLNDEEQLNYLTRNYFRFMMKDGAWAKMAKADEVGYGVLKQAILRDVYSAGKYLQMSPESRASLAQDHLDFLLGDPKMLARGKADPEGAWMQAVTKAGGSLKNRQTMDWWKKAALGEMDNAFVRIAETRARQEQLILQGEMFKVAADNPQLSTFGDNKALADELGHTELVPRDPKYGLLAGKYVHPDIWEALVQAPLAQRNASGTLAKMLNAVKWGQTVGNPGSWITNFYANAQGAVLSGLVNPFSSPYRIGHGMLTFAKDAHAHKLAPGIRGDVARDRFRRAMELGIVGSDYATAEFREGTAAWKRTLELEATKGPDGVFRVNPLNLFPRILSKAKGAAGGGKQKLSQLYGGIDTLWKYATYVSGLEKGGIDTDTGKLDIPKAIKFIEGRYYPGMDDAAIREAVELTVAQEIHYSFPMMDRVGEGIAAANKYGAPGVVVNPYLKVKTEMMRNYAQLPGRVGLGATGGSRRVLGNLLSWGATVGGLYFAMKYLRESQGVNQEEVDRSAAAAPQAIQRFKPGNMALWSRAENGKLRFVDLTSLFEPFSWLQGDPNTNWISRGLQNAAVSGIDGSIVEPGLTQLLAGIGVLDPGYQEKLMPEWQRGSASAIVNAGLKYGPGLFRNTYATLERGGVGFQPKGVKGPTQAPQSPLVTGVNLIAGPNRMQEMGGLPGGAGEADITRAIQTKAAELRAAEAEMSRIGAMHDGQSTMLGSTPLNKAEAQRKQRAIIERLKLEMSQLQTKLGRK